MLKEFTEKCHEDFWYYPKWAMCYTLMILATYMMVTPYGKVY
jgi:hypothetical protein